MQEANSGYLVVQELSSEYLGVPVVKQLVSPSTGCLEVQEVYLEVSVANLEV